MSNEKKFPQGIICKRNDGAPEFVLCSLSFKTDEFIKYLQDNSNNGWVNLDVKRSKGGKIYTDRNDWKPEGNTAEKSRNDISVEDLPF